jgi:hypothetical protein
MDEFLSSTSIPIIKSYIDIFMPFLTEPEWKVLCYLIRHNSCRSARFTLSEFSKGHVAKDGKRLDYGTGLSKNACRKALKSLCSLELIIELAPNEPKHNEGKLYAAQLDILKININFLKERFAEKMQRNQKRTKEARKSTKVAVLKSPLIQEFPVMSDRTTGIMSDIPTPLMSDNAPPIDTLTSLMSDKPTPIMSDNTTTIDSTLPAALDVDSSNLSELLHALQILNRQIPNPLSSLRQLAAQLDARGETIESMEWAFALCQRNNLNPVKDILLWLENGQLPEF